MSISPADLDVPTLGECAYDSPLSAILGLRRKTKHYVDESDRVLLDDTLGMVAERGVAELAQLPAFEPGGPRRRIFFDPTKTTVGIVTCGGLCPGLNDVIKHLVLEVWQHYGVRRILGLRFGYQGLVPRYGPRLSVGSVSRAARSWGLRAEFRIPRRWSTSCRTAASTSCS
jgi:6-phosphofructokinase 1